MKLYLEGWEIIYIVFFDLTAPPPPPLSLTHTNTHTHARTNTHRHTHTHTHTHTQTHKHKHTQAPTRDGEKPVENTYWLSNVKGDL
jgi:ABC-type nickel/cobalt efflux system permease component RcnA